MIEMPKVDISPDFTVEDIRKLRTAHAEFEETLTAEQLKEFREHEREIAREFNAEIQRMREARLAKEAEKTKGIA